MDLRFLKLNEHQLNCGCLFQKQYYDEGLLLVETFICKHNISYQYNRNTEMIKVI